MGLKVIGSGFGRTGTKSLKEALEQIGLGPCHHMYEVMDNQYQVAHWQDFAAGRTVDWQVAFAGYNAQVDWPGAHVWQELAAAFPDAKVIHSHRAEDVWWASFSRTIAKLMGTFHSMELPPHVHDMMAACETMIAEGTFQGKIADRDAAIAAYRQRAEDVKAAIPADRLLVFDVAEGWEPLCRFLGVPVPEAPFPHHNLRADFWEALGGEPA